jgi:hypothetical protein
MNGYIDPTFFCENHQSSKRVKAQSYQMILANKIIEVSIGPDDSIKTDSIFMVIPREPLQSLHQFVYPNAITKIIKVPLFTNRDCFINTDAVLFNLASTNIDHAWNTIDQNDIFYSDQEDEEEEEEEEKSEQGHDNSDKYSEVEKTSDNDHDKDDIQFKITNNTPPIEEVKEPNETTDIDVEML